MAYSNINQPKFYFNFPQYPDGTILPRLKEQLRLGTIWKSLDLCSPFCPLDDGRIIEIPNSQLRSIDRLFETDSYRWSSAPIARLLTSIWEPIVGSEMDYESSLSKNGENGSPSWEFMSSFTQLFIPTPEDMKKAIEHEGVASYIDNSKRKKPVYMITGLSWNEGVTFYLAVHGREGPILDESFLVVGVQVRKIWWEEHEDSFGATPVNSNAKGSDIMLGLKFVDNANVSFRIKMEESEEDDDDVDGDEDYDYGHDYD